MTATDPDALNPTGHPRLDWAVCSEVYRDVHAERIRAHQKHGAAGNSREDAAWDEKEWLPILMEEVGEVAHEMTYDVRPEGTIADHRRALRKELVQVAAMACAWISALDGDYD